MKNKTATPAADTKKPYGKLVTLRSLGIKRNEPMEVGRGIDARLERALIDKDLTSYDFWLGRQIQALGLTAYVPGNKEPTQKYMKMLMATDQRFYFNDHTGNYTGRHLSAWMVDRLINLGHLIVTIDRRGGEKKYLLCSQVNSQFGFNDPRINWGLPPGVKIGTIIPGTRVAIRCDDGTHQQAIILRPRTGWQRNSRLNWIGALVCNARGEWNESCISTVEIVRVYQTIDRDIDLDL